MEVLFTSESQFDLLTINEIDLSIKANTLLFLSC